MLVVETRLLKPVAQATVPARTKPVDAAEFFQTREGLHVYDSFRNRFDFEAPIQAVSDQPYVASLLKSDAKDWDIRKELPETHLSTLEDIAGFIEVQPNGKEGFLLTNGYVNLFYVMGKEGVVIVVDIYWSAECRGWDVRGWNLDEGGRWLAGYQVLCPGTASL